MVNAEKTGQPLARKKIKSSVVNSFYVQLEFEDGTAFTFIKFPSAIDGGYSCRDMKTDKGE